MPPYSRSRALQSPTTLAWLLLLGLTITTVAGFFALRQARKLTHYRPVQAAIRLSEVGVRSAHEGTQYFPQIEYEYTVVGRSYRSRTVFVHDVSKHDWMWANGWVSRYPVGRRIRAYHDPAHPQHAFLVRSPSFVPYGFVLFGLLLVTAALSVERARLDFGRRRLRFGAGEVCLGLSALTVGHFAYVWLITRSG